MLKKFDINAPIILGLAVVSLFLLFVNYISNGWINSNFAIFYSSFRDPLMYLRFFTHSTVHMNMAHYTGNFLLILAIGPLVEEKYGSKYTFIMILINSLIVGLIHVIFFHNVMLLGASSIAFMLIIMGSFVNVREGKIPLTVILVVLLYIGNEVIKGVTANDQISQLSHIIGGLSGFAAGFMYFYKKPRG